MNYIERGNIFKVASLSALFLFCAFFLSGCTPVIDNVSQQTTVSPNTAITSNLKVNAIGSSGSATGYLAILLPNSWEVSSSAYYFLSSTNYPTDYWMVSNTEFGAVSTLPAPPDGYHWYTAITPEQIYRNDGDEMYGFVNFLVGSATGTYNIEYWLSESGSQTWNSSSTQSVIVRTDPCADTTYTDGDSNGYLDVSTVCQLKNLVTNSTTAYYELTDDINFDTDNNAELLTGQGFAPIGVSTSPFRGRFNGNDHTITGLYINRPEADYVGLFGYVTGGTISNVNLVDTDVRGRSRVGGLVGRLYVGGTVSGSSVTGNITGEYYVGGLVGGALGSITNSRANVNVTGQTDFIGGLVGGTLGSISGSYSTGVVSTTGYTSNKASAGGLAGVVDTTGSVNNCSSSVDISGTWAVGGLVGSALGNITNSFATGNVTGTDAYVGGLVGSLSGNVSTTHATGRVVGNGAVGGLVGVSDYTPSSRGGIYDSYATGAVQNSGSGEWTGGLVGGTNAVVQNSYAIGNVNSSGDKTGGLIGGTDALVTSSYATGNMTSTGSMTGGLVGYSNTNSVISNCSSTGAVAGMYNVGGLVGETLGSVSNSHAISSVVSNITGYGGYNVGGLVGWVNGGSGVSNSSASGTITLVPSFASYHISQLVNGSWEEKYTKHFLVKYSSSDFDFTPINNQVTLRFNQKDIPFGDIDQIKLIACEQVVRPAYAKYVNSNQDVLGDILNIDNNVIVAHENPVEVSWNIPESCQELVRVSLYANEYGHASPLLFVGNYTVGQSKNYRPLWNSSTGHPDGYTYINITSDNKNIYYHLDITADNTNDKGLDWVEIDVDDNKFRVDDNTPTYGSCSFGITDKVSYKHQICDLIIPKNLINKNNFKFKLWYYGTAGSTGTGGLVGLLSASVISQSHASVAIETQYGYKVGGLIGESDYSTTTDSYATGNLTDTESNSYVGGLVGYLNYSAILRSFASGNVTNAGWQVGGLVGKMQESLIQNAYATGDVDSHGTEVGGLVGEDYAVEVPPPSIVNTYATGDVTGRSFVGGLVGYNYSDDVQNSFAVGSAVATDDEENYDAGLVGYDFDQNSELYTNNYWYNSLDKGIGNFDVNTTSGRWQKVESIDYFKPASSTGRPPFDLGDGAIWSDSVWDFNLGSFPTLHSITDDNPAVPQENVYVKTSYSEGNAGEHEYGVDAFNNISDALAAIAEGGTMHLLNNGDDDSDLTVSSSIEINRSIHIIGETLSDGDQVIIHSNFCTSSIFVITASNVTVDNLKFTMGDGGEDCYYFDESDISAVVVGGDSVVTSTQIASSTFLGCSSGIFLRLTASTTVISSNTFAGNFFGIWLEAGALIYDNSFDANFIDLIAADLDDMSSPIDLTGMVFTSNTLSTSFNYTMAGLFYFAGDQANPIYFTSNTINIDSGDAINVIGSAYNLHINGNQIIVSSSEGYHGLNVQGGIVDAARNWWGDASGPFEEIGNASSTGSEVYLDGSPLVFYRPFCINADCTRFSTNTLSAENLSSLITLYNGTITVSTSVPGDFATVNTINVNEDTVINIPVDDSQTTIILPAGTVITKSSGGIFSALDVTSTAMAVTSFSGFDANQEIQGAFQFGIPEIGLAFDPAITIQMYVGMSLSGQTLNIRRSLSTASGWTDTGLVESTCVVDSVGICTFHATLASYYAATKTVTPVSSGGGGSLSMSVTPRALPQYTKLDFTINNGDQVTANNVLNISMNADPKYVAGYAMSLDKNFSSAGINKYSSTTSFILPGQDGVYTLYLKYFSTAGDASEIISHSIEYKTGKTNVKTDRNIVLPFASSTFQVVKPTIASSNKYVFTRDLKFGMTGADVKELQKFLNANGYIVAKSGVGSAGKETTKFGTATKAALIKFQKANKIKPAAGYFGPTTRKVVNIK